MKLFRSLVGTVLVVLSATPLFALDYSNPQLGFKATLPDGLEDMSGQVHVKALISRGRLDATTKGPRELICLQDLGAPIGREDFSKRTDKPQNATVEKAAWKGFDITVFRIIEHVGSVGFVTFNAQVPLKPHAIQLTVAGPEVEEARLRQELQAILASIEGPTNWLTAEERARAPKQNLVAVAIGLFVLAVGRLRVTRHYGLAGTGARVAGGGILAAGIALPTLMAPVLRFAVQHGAGLNGMLYAWIGFNAIVIWGIIALLINHYGNAYAKVALEAEPVPAIRAPMPKRTPALVTECRMCQSSIPPEQQATTRTCPRCGADLTLGRR